MTERKYPATVEAINEYIEDHGDHRWNLEAIGFEWDLDGKIKLGTRNGHPEYYQIDLISGASEITSRDIVKLFRGMGFKVDNSGDVIFSVADRQAFERHGGIHFNINVTVY